MSEKSKISYYSKNVINCPVCGKEFKKEDLLSGGGRMNAGNLTDELHRLYIPTKKYGPIYPLIYPVVVCPTCLYSAYISDFETISPDSIFELKNKTELRKEEAKNLFPRYNFSKNRTIIEGILSYILAAICYDSIDSSHQPIYKQGLSCLRAAWLCNDYHLVEPNENFDYLRDVMYRKADFFYSQMVEAEKDGIEEYGTITHFGPDIDHNHGFDGALFLAGLLVYKHGQKDDKVKRLKSLHTAKITISRIVGMGKASKSKPSDFVESARELHSKIKDEINRLEENS
ncbi:DUF2225 domain-containing protein [Thiospirochaeta perfilievii]|uniref:DUF2225 domain-containing protein n=1 Tax=Thiospirochaeta perfilievii TaxID=252967 RepID=A0A5C1QES9_9SPIO|nr:DUF2225 domain-containing protein [Thiospirochaeta perfilievii]QEN05580.1 DUF2225 domain-containing protein [Thiospirochaeta perfilievii]